MNFKKYAAAAAFGLAAVLAGCSSSDSDSDKVSGAASSDVQSFEVVSCNSDIDAAGSAKLEMAKGDLVDFLGALEDGEIRRAQGIGSSIKSTYRQVLESHPANCEAQLGYALSSIANLVNSEALNSVLDSLEKRGIVETDSRRNLYKVSEAEMANLVVGTRVMAKQSSKVVTATVQDAVSETLLPMTDSAITFITNVVRNGSVTVLYTNGRRTVELDNGEFAPALGALYLMRAFMVAVASINIDFDENGSYDWIDSLIEVDVVNYKRNPGVKKALKLLDKDNPFATIRSDWAPAYKNIPNMLDSAITYVQVGLQYGIDEAANGLKTQLHDIYVVGDDEDADVSVSSLKAAIDTLSRVKDALHNDIEFKVSGKSYKVNVGKFFGITNVKKLLPYHKILPVDDWFKPGKNDFWSDTLGWNSFAHRELEALFKAAMPLTGKEEYVYVDFDSDYYDDEMDEFVETPVVDIDIEYEEGYAYGTYKVVFDGCKASFELKNFRYHGYGYWGDDEEAVDTVKVTKQVTLSSDFCKVEDGTAKFLTAEGADVPNVLVLTNKDGKELISFRDLVTGVKYPCDDHFHYRSYNLKELKEFLEFPDITFGGVFPGMTKDKMWELLADLEEYEDDYDDYDYDDWSGTYSDPVVSWDEMEDLDW